MRKRKHAFVKLGWKDQHQTYSASYAPFNQIIIFFKFIFVHIRTHRIRLHNTFSQMNGRARRWAARFAHCLCCGPTPQSGDSSAASVTCVEHCENNSDPNEYLVACCYSCCCCFICTVFLLLRLSSWCKHRSFSIIRLVNGIVCPILTNNTRTIHIRFELLCLFFTFFFLYIFFARICVNVAACRVGIWVATTTD